MPQSRQITVAGRTLVNLCANNLGLADHPAVVTARALAFTQWGFDLFGGFGAHQPSPALVFPPFRLPPPSRPAA